MSATKKTYLFNGTITAVGPLQVTYKDAVFGRDGGVRRLPRNGPLREDVGAYFPSTSLRGALRHAMHKVVHRAAQAIYRNEKPFALDEHFMLAQGVDITGEVEKEESDGVIDFGRELRSVNPALSLGGRWKLAAHASVNPMLPTTRDCIALYGGGARALMYERDETLIETLEEMDVEKLTRLLSEQSSASAERGKVDVQIRDAKKALKSADSEAKDDIRKQLASLEQEKMQIRDSRVESKDAIRRPLDSYEVFVAGTEFTHRMRLTSSTLLELGLWLATLREFARDPRVGGKKALGCGEVAAEWTVSYWPENEDKPVVIGQVNFSDRGFEYVGAELIAALEEWSRVQSMETIDFKRYLAG